MKNFITYGGHIILLYKWNVEEYAGSSHRRLERQGQIHKSCEKTCQERPVQRPIEEQWMMQPPLTRCTRMGDGWICCETTAKMWAMYFCYAPIQVVPTYVTPQPRLLAVISDVMHQNFPSSRVLHMLMRSLSQTQL